jgi:hypothetical protein
MCQPSHNGAAHIAHYLSLILAVNGESAPPITGSPTSPLRTMAPGTTGATLPVAFWLRQGHQPDIDPATATGQQADDYMNDRVARIMPGLVREGGQ